MKNATTEITVVMHTAPFENFVANVNDTVLITRKDDDRFLLGVFHPAEKDNNFFVYVPEEHTTYFAAELDMIGKLISPGKILFPIQNEEVNDNE